MGYSMPSVLLTVEAKDLSSAVLNRIQQSLVGITRQMAAGAISADELAAAWGRVGIGSGAAITGIKGMSTAVSGLNRSLANTATSVDRYLAAMQKVAGTSTTTDTSQDRLVQGTRQLSVALGDASIVIDSYTAALGRMDVAQLTAASSQRLLSGRTLGGGGGGRLSETPANILARGAAQDAGLAGRVTLAGLGGVGIGGAALAGGAAIYTAFKATQAASSFWSAVAQAGAQSATLQNPAQMQSFGQSLLDYASSGKSLYSATQLAQGAEVPLASGYSLKAIQQGLPSIASLSAQNKSPDLSLADQLVTSVITSRGIKPQNVTGKDIISASDFVSKAETLTKATPGLLTSALPTLLGALPGSGIGTQDATALLLKMGTVNPRLQRDATSINQLITSTQVKPTAGATTEANKIGLAIGPGSAGLYGGAFGWLQALKTLSGGDASIISKILPQKNAYAAYNDIMAGGGISQAGGYSDALSKAAGSGQKVQDQLRLGTQQQETALANRFNADLVSMGNTINSTVVPALLNLANAALRGLEKGGEAAGKSGPPNLGIPGFNPTMPGSPMGTLNIPNFIHNLTGWGLPGGSTNPLSVFTGGDSSGKGSGSGRSTSVFGGDPNMGYVPGAAASGGSIPGFNAISTMLSALPTTTRTAMLNGYLAIQKTQATGAAKATMTDSLDAIKTAILQGQGASSLQPLFTAYAKAVINNPSLSASAQKYDITKEQNDINKYLVNINKAATATPFTQLNPGMGAFQAGTGSTAVRFGGGQDPQTAETAKLRHELNTANQEIRQLLSQIAKNTSTPLPLSRHGGVGNIGTARMAQR